VHLNEDTKSLIERRKVVHITMRKGRERKEERERTLNTRSEVKGRSKLDSIDMGKVLWESILTLPAPSNALLCLITYLRKGTQK